MCQESRLGRLVWSGLVWMVLNSRPLMNDKGGLRAARAAKNAISDGGSTMVLQVCRIGWISKWGEVWSTNTVLKKSSFNIQVELVWFIGVENLVKVFRCNEYSRERKNIFRSADLRKINPAL